MSKKEEISNPYKDSIADLLSENDIDINADVDVNTLTFNRTPSLTRESDSKVLVKAKEKAENVMTSLLKLYLSDGFISKSEYVQAKVNLDSMTLGKIMNQMEVSEREQFPFLWRILKWVTSIRNYLMHLEISKGHL